MGSEKDAKIFSKMRTSTDSAIKKADRASRRAQRAVDTKGMMALALKYLAEDWNQPAEQSPLKAIINRWCFLKADQPYWAEELIDGLVRAQKGRPSEYVGGDEFEPPKPAKDLVPVPMGPLEVADRKPCPSCSAPAYMVLWRHEDDHDESFGSRIHNKKFVLCASCRRITPTEKQTCRVCER